MAIHNKFIGAITGGRLEYGSEPIPRKKTSGQKSSGASKKSAAAVAQPAPGRGTGGKPAQPSIAMPQAIPQAFAPLQPLQPMQPVQPLQPARPLQPTFPTFPVRPALPFHPTMPFLPLLPRTTTQLAQAAVRQLAGADSATLTKAVNALRSRNLRAAGLMDHLERKVKVGEVLSRLAKDWSRETRQDFVEAVPMDVKETAVMDAVVSIATLNDPDLEEEILAENLGEVTEENLLDQRAVVFQYPPPGTPLEPPYVVLVAVEHREVAEAEEVAESILDDLVEHQGYKLPSAAADKLRRR